MKEFQLKVSNIKEKKAATKTYSEDIRIPLINAKQNKVLNKEEQLNVYSNTEMKVREEKKIVDKEIVIAPEEKLDDVQSYNDNVGCFSKLWEWISPNTNLLKPTQKKHIWYGKLGAFDKKFQDNRDYFNNPNS